MSEIKIRQALETALAAMTPALPTVFHGAPPPAGFDATKPHQKAYLLRAPNRSVGLSEKTTVHSGTFQVSLCYPTGNGAGAIDARAVAIQAHFYAGRVLEKDGVKIRIKGKPSIGDPVTLSPLVVPVSIRFESIFR